jgi:hypothetical protein
VRNSSLYGPHEVRCSSSLRAPQQCKIGFPARRGPEPHVEGDLETCRSSLEKDIDALIVNRNSSTGAVSLKEADSPIR